MKLALDTAMRTLDGMSIQENGQPVTLRRIIIDSLLAGPAAARDGNGKIQQYDLALRIHRSQGEVAELTSEDLTEIKRCIGLAATPLIVGQCFRLIEGQDTGIEVYG